MSIIDNMVKEMNAAEIMSKLEEEGKNIVRVQIICWFGIRLQGVYLN